MLKPFLILTLVAGILLTLLLLAGCGTVRSVGNYSYHRRQAEFARYPNFINGAFRSLYDTSDSLRYVDTARIRLHKKKRKFARRPKLSKDMPTVLTNLKDTVFDRPTVVWFGHSSYLIQSKGYTILVDPVLSDYASPVWYINRSIRGSHAYRVDDMPPVDLILITHDHYDHLDCRTIRRYRKEKTRAIAPLGVGSLLDHWGWKADHYREVYWGDTVSVAPGIRIVSTPQQHFSGRFLKKNLTLWTSYVLDIHGYRLFLGGDGGYNRHFRDIGEAYGPFDLAILENGQYNLDWCKNHSFPEQTVHTAQDLRARMVLPVHWARYAAAYHDWNDPIVELLPQLDAVGIPVTVPRIGEPYTLGDEARREVWWDFD